jgi:hypothetical protein
MSSLRRSIDAPLAVELEFRKEQASSLRRTGDKLEGLLAQMKQMEGELRTLQGPGRPRKVVEYQQLREDAEYLRWCLVVQREAIGLFNHSEVDLMYPVPPKLK